jgi:hypothetical protein
MDHILFFQGRSDVTHHVVKGAQWTDKAAENPAKEKRQDNNPKSPPKAFDPLVP